MAALRALGERLPPDVRTALAVWLAVKLAALLLGWLLWQTGFVQQISEPPTWSYPGFALDMGPVTGWTLGVWQRFDTIHYLSVAERGYRADDVSLIYPPLYPGLIRRLAPVFAGSSLAAALAIANVCFIIALALQYRLVAPVLGDGAARRSLWLLGLYPSAYYLQGGYTEPLFMALALGAFLCLRARRWWLAGGLAMLATLTRVQGVALAAPLAFEYVRQTGWSPRRWSPALAAAALGPLGLLGFWAWQRAVGLPPFEQVLQSGWFGSVAAAPWVSIAAAAGWLFSDRFRWTRLPSFGALALFGALTIILAWPYLRGRPGRVPPAWVVYMAAMLLLVLSRYMPGWPLIAMSRHVLVLFPGFALLGWAGQRPWLWRLMLYSFIPLYVASMGLFFMWGYLE